MSPKSTPDFTRMSERDMILYLCYESEHTASTEYVKDALGIHVKECHPQKKRGSDSIMPPKGGKGIDWGLVKLIAIIMASLLAGGGTTQIVKQVSAEEGEAQSE